MKNGITHDNKGLPVKELSEDYIAGITEVYVCPSFACNLNCPHCTLQYIKDPVDIDAVCDTLDFLLEKSPKLMYFTVFGGEPLLLSEENWAKLESRVGKRQYSISTNLIALNDTNIEHIKRCIMPDTSWNPLRFGVGETGKALYNKWRENLQKLHDANIDFEVMVTLTKDLITNYTPQQFLDECEQWGATLVRFEQMIGDDTLDFADVDNWLVEVYKLWDKAKYGKNVMFSKLARIANKELKWEEHCFNTVTIMPNGNIKHSCPYFEDRVEKKECWTCEYADVCKGGCPLQERCTFPKKTYEYILQHLNDVDLTDAADDSMYANARCMSKDI